MLPLSTADVLEERLPPAIVRFDSLRDAPPSLRILPARFYVREAKFRYPVYKASKKSGTLHTSDIGHWFAIGTTFGAFLLFTNVKSQRLQKSLFRASAHTGVGTPKVLGYFVERKAQRYDY